jgi:hypothetical protein
MPPSVEPTPIVEPTPQIEPTVEPTPQPLEGQEPGFAAVEPVPMEATPEPSSVDASEPALGSQDVDALVERVAERVIAKLSEHVIKEVAWEVVPDLAQTLLRKEIDALKAKIPK